MQIKKSIIELNKKGDFDFFLQVELQHYSELQHFLDQVSSTDYDQKKDSLLTTEQKQKESQTRPMTSLSMTQSQQETASLQILALGEARVLLNRVPITRWRMARAMELFFFLLENGRLMRKDQIAVALWPDQDGELADSTVRTTIYYLRKALGGEASIIYQSDLYSLNLSAISKDKVWYDVEVFNEQYHQAKKALENEDDETAASVFARTVDLYQGDYVQAFYNDWCIFRRDKLQQACMDARHQLALIAWRREDWEGSLHHWQHLLSMDSCDEKAHYGIMRCYLQKGKRERENRH